MHAYLTEGQKQAKRLAKNINKESINLRRMLKQYNSCVELLRQYGRIEMRELTWEEISDVTSSIYQINISADDGIPISIKRNIVDAVNLNKRLCEEELYLLNGMKNCVDSFYTSCVNREKSLNDLGITSNDVDHEENKEKCDDELKKGIYAIQSKELYEDRVNLCAAYNMFVDCLPFSDEIVNYVKQYFQSNDDNVSENDSEDDVEYDEEIDVQNIWEI